MYFQQEHPWLQLMLTPANLQTPWIGQTCWNNQQERIGVHTHWECNSCVSLNTSCMGDNVEAEIIRRNVLHAGCASLQISDIQAIIPLYLGSMWGYEWSSCSQLFFISVLQPRRTYDRVWVLLDCTECQSIFRQDVRVVLVYDIVDEVQAYVWIWNLWLTGTYVIWCLKFSTSVYLDRMGTVYDGNPHSHGGLHVFVASI